MYLQTRPMAAAVTAIYHLSSHHLHQPLPQPQTQHNYTYDHKHKFPTTPTTPTTSPLLPLLQLINRASAEDVTATQSFADRLIAAVGADRRCRCFIAKDNRHFFANELCHECDLPFCQVVERAVSQGNQPHSMTAAAVVTSAAEMTLGDAAAKCLPTKEPERLYCRLRPIPCALESEILGDELFGNDTNVGVDCRRDGAEMANVANPVSRNAAASEAEADDAATTENAMVEFRRDLCACWIASAGAITPLHFDLCHGLLVSLHGTKRFTLFPPSDTPYLYRKDPLDANPNSSRVAWETWREQHDKWAGSSAAGVQERKAGHAYWSFPKVAETTPTIAEVGPGDVLYTPPGWWHHVEGLTSTVAVLLPFDMSPGEELHEALFR